MTMLPSSLSSFTSSHETIPAPEHEAEYPYSEFSWKPVACALLSGRVRPRQEDQQPNRTQMERFCKQANFNQSYFAGVAQFHVASGVIKAQFDKFIKDGSDANNFILRCQEHGFEVKGF